MTDPKTTTADHETNREIIRQAFDAWQRGTGANTDVFAPDMVWRIEGHSVASREYRDRQEFIDEVLAPFRARFADGEPFRPATIRSIHADADTVVVVWDGRGVANGPVPTRPATPGSCDSPVARSSTAPPSATASPSTTCGLESRSDAGIQRSTTREVALFPCLTPRSSGDGSGSHRRA